MIWVARDSPIQPALSDRLCRGACLPRQPEYHRDDAASPAEGFNGEVTTRLTKKPRVSANVFRS